MIRSAKSQIISIMMNITPARNPSITSFVLIFRIYIIPKNTVVRFIITGTTIFIWGKWWVKIGFNICVTANVIIHIRIPKIIANFNFIFKPYVIVRFEKFI